MYRTATATALALLALLVCASVAHAAPANDNFALAQALTGSGPAIVNGSNVGATVETGEPRHLGLGGGASVWYKFTAPANGRLAVETYGSSFDTVIAVYTGTSVGALTLVAGNDDAFGNVSQSHTVPAVSAGTTYWIAVDGKGAPGYAATGAIRLRYKFASAPPANDKFANAIQLTGNGGTVSGTNMCATVEPGEPKIGYYTGAASVWYKWTAPSDGSFSLSMFHQTYITLVGVYTGNSVGSLTQVGWGGWHARIPCKAGQTYRICVDGLWEQQGDFGFTWHRSAVPANDNFANAQEITGTAGHVAGNNEAASVEASEPKHSHNANIATVWYKWTAPESGRLIVDTFGSSFDTILAAYTGDALASLTKIVVSDDASGTGWSRVIVPVTEGTTYRLVVGGDDPGDQGDVSLNWRMITQPPANDNFANALEITRTAGSLNTNCILATREPGEPEHTNNTGAASIWFKFKAPSNGAMQIDVVPDGFRCRLAVYTGTALNALTPVAGDPFGRRAVFRTTRDTTYRIAIDGRGEGFINLSWMFVGTPPANDNFANAQPLTQRAGSLTTNNLAATKEAGEPNHAWIGGASIWYKFTAPVTGALQVDTIGSDFDTLLGAYTGTGVANLTQVACDNNYESFKYESRVRFRVEAGRTYSIAVDGAGGQMGGVKFNWQFQPSPPNDDFARSQVMTSTAGTITANNFGGTKETSEPAHADDVGGASLWYRWTAPAGGALLVSLKSIDSQKQMLLGIYSGSTVGGLTRVVRTYPTTLGGHGAFTVSFRVPAGRTYRIAVDGRQMGRTSVQPPHMGDFTLTWQYQPPPANDNFANAQALTGSVGTITASNLGATKETSEPAHAGNQGGASLWYKFTAPATGHLLAETRGSAIDTLLGVYQGTSVGALTKVADSDDAFNTFGHVAIPVTGGQAYRIAVDGKYNTTTLDAVMGMCNLHWRFASTPPANDNFANAIPIPAGNGALISHNVHATKQTGEPNHAGVPGGASIWFKYVPSEDCTPQLYTLHPDYKSMVLLDSVMAVYTGASVGALTEVASNNDYGYRVSLVRWTAQAGKTYYVAIDTVGADMGYIGIDYKGPPPPLGPVTSFKAASGNRRAFLSWRNPIHPNLDNVRILRSTAGFATTSTPGGGQTQIYEGLDESTIATGLANGTKYYLTAYAHETRDRWSRPVTCTVIPNVTAPGVGTPAIPALVPAGGPAVSISGTISPSHVEASSVRLYFWKKIGTVWTAQPGYVNVPLAAGATSYSKSWTAPSTGSWYIKAYHACADHTAAYSGARYFTALAKPGPATRFRSTPGNRKVYLAWTKPSYAALAGVRILRSTTRFATAPVQAGQTRIYQGLGASLVATSLVNNTRHYFTAFAIDKWGRASVAATTTAIPKLAAATLSVPTIAAIVHPNTNFTISGTASPAHAAASSVRIYFWKKVGTSWVKQTTYATATLAAWSTSYSTTWKLTSTGNYYAKAYHTCADHPAVYSGARYFTVQ